MQRWKLRQSELLLRYLRNNLLSGGIPPEFGNITTLVQLDLSDDHLSGVLPHELGSLVNLTDLCFMEHQVLAEFVCALKISKNSIIEAPLLPYLSIMMQNMDSEHAIWEGCIQAFTRSLA